MTKDHKKKQLTSKTIPDKVDSALELAQKGHFKQASAMLSKLKKKHSHNSDVQFGLGVMSLYSRKIEEAICYFDKAIQIDPFYIKAHFNRAMAYQQIANVKCVAESLKNVINLSYIDSELAEYAQKQLDELSEIISDNSGTSLDQFIEAQMHFDTGFEYMKKHELDKAIPCFKRAASINTDTPQAYGNLGICYACLGEKETALNYFDEALRIDPDYEVARINRSLVEKLGTNEKLNIPAMRSINYYVEGLK